MRYKTYTTLHMRICYSVKGLELFDYLEYRIGDAEEGDWMRRLGYRDVFYIYINKLAAILGQHITTRLQLRNENISFDKLQKSKSGERSA